MDRKLLARLWNEEAAVISHHPGADEPRRLVRQEPLWKVLQYLDGLKLADRLNLTITFPDRHLSPMRLQHYEIEALLRNHDRPGFRTG